MLTRQQAYINACNFEIIPKLFIVVVLEIRSFDRLVKNLPKPICEELQVILENSMIKTIFEIQNAIFGYFYQNRFIFYLRNDGNVEPWHHNKIQNVCSALVTQLTLQFYKERLQFVINLNGEAYFRGQVYCVPSLDETVDDIFSYQKDCVANSVGLCAKTILPKVYGKELTYSMLLDKSIEDKKEILKKLGTDWELLPSWFKFGTAAYKVPTLPNSESSKVRKKWILNKNLHLVNDDRDWYSTIIKNGFDIFRAENVF